MRRAPFTAAETCSGSWHLADIVAFYGRARAAADAAIAEIGPEETGTAWFGDPVTMRWVLIHMVEETCRHVGHMDICAS